MKLSRLIHVVDSHTCGEPTRVVVGGLPHIPGETVKDRMFFFRDHMDHLRTLLLYEPRGHANMVAAILTPPVSKSSEFSEFFLNPAGVFAVCGHGTIGAATVAVQTGMVAPEGDNTTFNIDTAVGAIRANVQKGERIAGVAINMVPSLFMDQVRFEVPSIGTLVADIVYGGNYFYAQLDSKQGGWKLAPENSQQLIEMALKIRETTNQLFTFRHPEYPWVQGIRGVDFYGPSDQPDVNLRLVHVSGTGQIDRSPCGSATAARMAALYAQGRLKKGEVYVQESILGTTFKGRVIEETKVAGHSAVLTEITGRAFITGFNQLILEDEDPLDKGFLLGVKSIDTQ